MRSAPSIRSRRTSYCLTNANRPGPPSICYRCVDIFQASHDAPAVLSRALEGADGLFWLVPPGLAGAGTEERYLGFTRPAADAIRRCGVPHLVGVSSAGHDWPTRAGVLSAAFAMDAEIERTGTAYRALRMPFYMENLLAQLGTIREQGSFPWSAFPGIPPIARWPLLPAAR